jgi:Leucine-rich repeat (LRR) protein
VPVTDTIFQKSGMRLSKALDINVQCYSSFDSLKVLSLRSTLITCEDIRAIAPLLVNLEELSIGCNELKDIDIVSNADTAFQRLRLIHLESNEIDSWEKVCKLSKLPR